MSLKREQASVKWSHLSLKLILQLKELQWLEWILESQNLTRIHQVFTGETNTFVFRLMIVSSVRTGPQQKHIHQTEEYPRVCAENVKVNGLVAVFQCHSWHSEHSSDGQRTSSVCVCVSEWVRERERECVCEWVSERECVCVCVWVSERERERKRECVCVWVSEWVSERERVWVSEWVSEWERESVCVWERERERERENATQNTLTLQKRDTLVSLRYYHTLYSYFNPFIYLNFFCFSFSFQFLLF